MTGGMTHKITPKEFARIAEHQAQPKPAMPTIFTDPITGETWNADKDGEPPQWVIDDWETRHD